MKMRNVLAVDFWNPAGIFPHDGGTKCKLERDGPEEPNPRGSAAYPGPDCPSAGISLLLSTQHRSDGKRDEAVREGLR